MHIYISLLMPIILLFPYILLSYVHTTCYLLQCIISYLQKIVMLKTQFPTFLPYILPLLFLLTQVSPSSKTFSTRASSTCARTSLLLQQSHVNILRASLSFLLCLAQGKSQEVHIGDDLGYDYFCVCYVSYFICNFFHNAAFAFFLGNFRIQAI